MIWKTVSWKTVIWKTQCGVMVLVMLASGCGESAPAKVSEHERQVIELAKRHAEQQAAQSQRMTEIQKQWATERSELNKQRDQLETERQDVAKQRMREPLIAASIQEVGTLALCLLPLIVCALLLWKSNAPDDGNAIAETLVTDLMSAKPTLFGRGLPAPPTDGKPAGRLTATPK